MTNRVDLNRCGDSPGKSFVLPFPSSDAEMQGIRVTRAEFSRMMGCSKQAVTDWVKSGRIVVGADGRFDPRQAVASLMRTGDPARIRAKVLEPLVRDITGRDREIARLRTELAAAKEEAEFHEASASEFVDLFDGLVSQIVSSSPELVAAGTNSALSAIVWWLEAAVQKGTASAGMLLSHVETAEVEPDISLPCAFEVDEGRREYG